MAEIALNEGGKWVKRYLIYVTTHSTASPSLYSARINTNNTSFQSFRWLFHIHHASNPTEQRCWLRSKLNMYLCTDSTMLECSSVQRSTSIEFPSKYLGEVFNCTKFHFLPQTFSSRKIVFHWLFSHKSKEFVFQLLKCELKKRFRLFCLCNLELKNWRLSYLELHFLIMIAFVPSAHITSQTTLIHFMLVSRLVSSPVKSLK